MGVSTSLEYRLETGGILHIINNSLGNAYCPRPRRQFPLVQTIPTDLLRHCFGFLMATQYLCGVSVVCKKWHNLIHIDMNDICEESLKFKRMQDIMYNTFAKYLLFANLRAEYRCGDYVPSPLPSRSELLYGLELNTSFASLYTEPCEDCEHIRYIMETYSSSATTDVLFFEIDKTLKRKRSYSYLLHYIYLFGFGEFGLANFDKMNSMLARLLFTGSTLFTGYMIHLFFRKYGLSKWRDRCFASLSVLFQDLYLNHENNIYLNNKEVYVLFASALNLLRYLLYLSYEDKVRPQWWHELMRQSPDNILNDLIKCVMGYVEIWDGFQFWLS